MQRAPISGDLKVGELARIWPQTMKGFARYKLDLCCGGVHPIELVAEKHKLDLGQLLAKLNAAVTREVGRPA